MKMERLEEEILKKLLSQLEKYQRQNDFQTRQRPIRLSIKDHVFDGYRNNENGTLELVLSRLEEEGFVSLHKTQGFFDYLDLNLDDTKISEIYSQLGRTNPAGKKNEYLNELKGCLQKYDSELAHSFEDEMIKRLEQGKLANVETYFSSTEELHNLCKVLDAMDRLDSEILERNFSSKTVGDSKVFTALRNHLAKIIREFSDEPFDDDDDPIEAYGILKNTSLAAIKGKAVIKVGNQEIDLSKLGQPMFLNDESIKNMKIESIRTDKLMTIENLTTFNTVNGDFLYIYLGGFHNKVRRDLILKMKEEKPSLNCYHFGDIDAGGFYILNHLREKTGIEFKPYHMGIPELQEYKKYCKPLTQNDVKRLKKMLQEERFKEFYDVFECMLTNNEKLEQEAES